MARKRNYVVGMRDGVTLNIKGCHLSSSTESELSSAIIAGLNLMKRMGAVYEIISLHPRFKVDVSGTTMYVTIYKQNGGGVSSHERIEPVFSLNILLCECLAGRGILKQGARPLTCWGKDIEKGKLYLMRKRYLNPFIHGPERQVHDPNPSKIYFDGTELSVQRQGVWEKTTYVVDRDRYASDWAEWVI